MRGKFFLAVGLGTGYVLGARAGRRRYEQIARTADKVWNSSPVQKRVHEAELFVRDKAPVVLGFARDTASKVSSAASEAGEHAGSSAEKAASAVKRKTRGRR